jgi:ketosteroid isomerase-like protein
VGRGEAAAATVVAASTKTSRGRVGREGMPVGEVQITVPPSIILRYSSLSRCPDATATLRHPVPGAARRGLSRLEDFCTPHLDTAMSAKRRETSVSSSNDPMAEVRQYVDAFNSADPNAMAAVCADPMQILDGMSPHVWQGSTAAEDWWSDVLEEGEHLGASGYHITLGEPRHVDITGDYAYVVVPATMTFSLGSKPITQTGSVFTVALRKVGTDWRLTAWAWAKGA